MGDVNSSRRFLRLFIWICIVISFVQTVTMAETMCVQTPCKWGYCCDESGNTTVSELPCCCNSTAVGLSTQCISHSTSGMLGIGLFSLPIWLSSLTMLTSA
ncbi:uncharacterized protein LOC128228359 [Mya arenaria]|uniref:uncharacterized protein LOC128228359 n=1 Tax=Mya arenaria TaxID=6604 RepID=UPI0022E39B2C|nr:uncharacterized protein LOC128228359 [Mya arenaria]